MLRNFVNVCSIGASTCNSGAGRGTPALTNILFRRWIRGSRFTIRKSELQADPEAEAHEDEDLQLHKVERESRRNEYEYPYPQERPQRPKQQHQKHAEVPKNRGPGPQSHSQPQSQSMRNQQLLRQLEARNPTKLISKGDTRFGSDPYQQMPMRPRTPEPDFNRNRDRYNRQFDSDSSDSRPQQSNFDHRDRYNRQFDSDFDSEYSRPQQPNFDRRDRNNRDFNSDVHPNRSKFEKSDRHRNHREFDSGSNLSRFKFPNRDRNNPEVHHQKKRTHKLSWSEAQHLQQGEDNGGDGDGIPQKPDANSGRSQHTGPTSKITKLLDSAAKFDDAVEEENQFIQYQKNVGKQTLPKTREFGADPFISSPYTLETKFPNQFFPGGETAMDEALRKKINPSTTSVIMFPGQGTQYVGMCGNPNQMPKSAQDLFNNASEILEYDLLDLCLNGPIEKLNRTEFCQPAIVVSSLAALEKLREQNEYAVESCVSTAGFSIGEITALIFAGCLSFEDAIRLVKIRAEAMQLASDMVPSGMATVLYRPDSEINFALKVARSWCTREYQIEEPVCSIANYLFPHCKVIAGHIQAIEFLEKNYTDFKLKKVKRLQVSGAFHTKLMKPAEEALTLALNDIEISQPRIPVFSNVTGYRYHTSEEVRKKLPKQVCEPVMWEQIVHHIYNRPKGDEYPSTYECGPGTSLTTVLRLVNARAHDRVKTVGVEPVVLENTNEVQA